MRTQGRSSALTADIDICCQNPSGAMHRWERTVNDGKEATANGLEVANLQKRQPFLPAKAVRFIVRRASFLGRSATQITVRAGRWLPNSSA